MNAPNYAQPQRGPPQEQFYQPSGQYQQQVDQQQYGAGKQQYSMDYGSKAEKFESVKPK
jgi:hypothetical protein